MSTSTSYLLLSRDLTRSLARVASSRTVASAGQYYQANIGKVKTVDDLMKDARLFNYVMKAHGLEDMAYAKAFIRKVLTSDLSDQASFANKLTDKRYRELASAFNFNAAGEVVAITDIQSDAQEQEITGLYSRSVLARDEGTGEAVAGYRTGMAAITSVDDFLADESLFRFALTAHGLADRAPIALKSFYRDLLTSDTSDPAHPVNLIADTAYRNKLLAFASAFSFAADGSTAAGGAQSAAQQAATVDGYLGFTSAQDGPTGLLNATETYRNDVAGLTDVDDLIADTKIYTFVLSAHGLDPAKVDPADVRAALVSDPDDPAGASSQLGAAFQRMARAFNFSADGSLPPGTPAQDDAAVTDTVTRFLAHKNAAQQEDLAEFTTYKLIINNATSVPDVDAFLANASVYNFAMRAFTIDPAFTSKAFVRQVLTSDLSDPASFANQQSDPRYRTLAGLFNFQPDGTILNGGPLQTDAAMEELQQRFIAAGFGPSLSDQATTAYHFDMAKVTDVDTFLSDKSSFSFALVAFGFNKDTASAAFFRQILTSDLSDPSSVANQQTDARYRDFAAAFNFATDGSLPGGVPAQSKVGEDLMIERFQSRTDRTSAAYRMRLTDEYKTAVLGLRTVASFLDTANDAIYKLALQAFAIDPAAVTRDQVEQVLTSNLDDPASAAAKLGGRFVELARAFNFGTTGVVPVGVDTQSASQLAETVIGYLAHANPAADAAVASETTRFKRQLATLETLANISGTTAVDEFLDNEQLFDYALTAYGLDAAAESRDTIRRALTSDKASRFSFLNQPGNEKYLGLANALNFDPDGSVGTPRLAQNLEDARTTAQKYAASFTTTGLTTGAKAAQDASISAETEYYAGAIIKIKTADQWAADTRLTGYVLRAFGLTDAKLSASDLTKILTSDLADPQSFANKTNNQSIRELAAAFNFDAQGLSRRIPERAAQTSGAAFATSENYVRQTLETDAGADNPGVRLALYFARKAPEITGPYSILADKALAEVVRTALQIPDAAARADLDVLARTIERRLNVADLKDPAKLDRFLKRFTALYDLANPSSGSTVNAASAILGTGGGISQGLLAGMQRIRPSRF